MGRNLDKITVITPWYYKRCKNRGVEMYCPRCGDVVSIGEKWFSHKLRRVSGLGLSKTKLYCLKCADELNMI
jgi:hypothetical protein